MTVGELFRQVAKELDGVVDDAACDYADTVTPSMINRELPPGTDIAALKARLVEQGRKIKAMKEEDRKRMLRDFLSHN
jgi:hypothetical protein